MRVSIALEQRFCRTADGRIWTTDDVYGYRFWQRYLKVFHAVNVIARVEDRRGRESTASDDCCLRADGPDVGFTCVPHFIGPQQYIYNARRIHNILRNAIDHDDAVILRTPGTIANCLIQRLMNTTHPYAVEVVGDPYDVFAPGAVKHPLRPFFRWLFSRRLRLQCENASACSYVTEKKLQQRYPPGNDCYATHYSSIELPPEAIAAAARSHDSSTSRLSIIHVGGLSQLYKAPDVLIDAVARCVQQGMDLRLSIIGDGRCRRLLHGRPAARQLGDRLSFLGQLPKAAMVREELDRADLFVLPSRTEGLPRAMIEAMARGLPCIGSTAGGFAELLPTEDLVPPGDVDALAAKIREVTNCSRRMDAMSRRNLEKSKQYRSDVLERRRTAFYQYIKETKR